MIASVFTVEEKTVKVYDRALKEARLLTTGARGVNAPDMTPLDAARMTIALLACDGPSQAVERVRQFGALPYYPDYRTNQVWRETVGPEEFASIFPANTLEEVLAFIYSVYQDRPPNEASRWFDEHVFSLTINPFHIRADLELWKSDDGKIVGERVIAFKGDWRAPQHAAIKGGLLIERMATPATLARVALEMWAGGTEGQHGRAK